jgi:hypothetical protein
VDLGQKGLDKFGYGIITGQRTMKPLKTSTVSSEQRRREKQIERLARDLGGLIRGAQLETQDELKEAAFALLREEAAGFPEPKHLVRRGPMNPLAVGLGIFVVGAALTVLLPPVGVTLALCGLVGIFWGTILSLAKK